MSCRKPFCCSTACQACRAGWWPIAATPAMPFVSTPAAAARGAGRLSGLDLQQPQCRRAPLGSAEGVARRCNPLREDCIVLHGHTLSGRHSRLAQALIRPSRRLLPLCWPIRWSPDEHHRQSSRAIRAYPMSRCDNASVSTPKGALHPATQNRRNSYKQASA
jgi:hypothetical protein